MDAPDDRDIKVQRASGDLIKEFAERLPVLLWKSTEGKPHRWADIGKTNRLLDILERFQEWPQIWDPHLHLFLTPLVDAFLAYLIEYRHRYGSTSRRALENAVVLPLPRAICKILNSFCKVRGVKVISRFLNNEPKYLDLMLRTFIDWDAINPEEQSQSTISLTVMPLVWEERYIMLLWLSHLLLAPFDLASMSSDDIPIPYDNLRRLGTFPPQTPRVTFSILSVCLQYVVTAGKEREAASSLLVRLVLRPDMQKIGLPKISAHWAFSVMQPSTNAEVPPTYTCIGLLSFLARLGSSAQVDDLAPIVTSLYARTLRLAHEESAVLNVIQSSALARKMIVKILRMLTVQAMELAERKDGRITEDELESILEDSIDYFLLTLADRDVPVRLAASKALAVITLKLDSDMGAEVAEAVIGSLGENILYEKQDGSLVTPLEAKKLKPSSLKPNLSAVDSQKWHGLILTLAHLLFRRAPPPRQLPELLQSLTSALDFDQRSSTGASLGIGVRDAACFGIWSLSRKYTSKELLDLDARTLNPPTEQQKKSVIQTLAVELVCSACVDPSGNIRRGASAALQELIGRHPDTIVKGIELVQVVDYHAVARRSRAMVEVAKSAAEIDSIYWTPLMNSLLFWRGISASDADSRRTAALAIGALSTQNPYEKVDHVLQLLHRRFSKLPHNDVETRHGCLLALHHIIEELIRFYEDEQPGSTSLKPAFARIHSFWDIFDSPSAPTIEDLTRQSERPELTAEAISRLISSLARACVIFDLDNPTTSLLDKAVGILILCVSRGEDIVIEVASEAASSLFQILPDQKQEAVIQDWFSNIHDNWKSATGRGQIAALGAVFNRVSPESGIRDFIFEELLRCTADGEFIQKRASAVRCLTSGVLPYIELSDGIADELLKYLSDYTTDRRGDIGSFVRIEAIHAIQLILELEKKFQSPSYMAKILGYLGRLAAEKLDKVRFQAWVCLEHYWEMAEGLPSLSCKYEHFSQVSSPEYFAQLLQLLHMHTFRLYLIQGFITSATSGTETLVRSSRLAFTKFIHEQEGDRRSETMSLIFEDLISILDSNIKDDRYTLPALEMIDFCLDNYLSMLSTSQTRNRNFDKLFTLVQKSHFKSSNIHRLEAAVKLYSTLIRVPSVKSRAVSKLISMLLHPYPKVRIAVADYLFMETRSESVLLEDWTLQPKELRTTVEKIKSTLIL